MNEKEIKLFDAVTDLSDETIRAAFDDEPPRAASRGKTFLRVGLIAAVLVLLFGVGVLAERRGKWLTEQIVPLASADEDESLTKEVLVARALSTTARFDTVSVEFEHWSLSAPKISVRIDSDLQNAKACEHCVAEEYEWERFTDGEDFFRSDQNADAPFFYISEGGVMIREDVDYTFFEQNPRTFYDERARNFADVDQINVVNALNAHYCLIPDAYVFDLLNEGETWEITGEGKYLGRKAVEARGVCDPNTAKRNGAAEFFLRFDQKTGILLTLELYNEAGETVESMNVSKLLIDETQKTRAEIDRVLEKNAAEIERLKAAAQQQKEEEERDRLNRMEQNEEMLQKDLNAPSQITRNAQDEELTKEAIVNRMLNTVDYFDTVTVTFTYRTHPGKFETDVTVDSDLRTHKAFSGRTDLSLGHDRSFEDRVADGKNVYTYYNLNKTYSYFGLVSVRTEAEEAQLAEEPRLYDGKFRYRSDLTNSVLSSYCLLPEGLTVNYLGDFSVWEIVGKTQYLGRECIEIRGRVENEYWAAKRNNTAFCMYVDEATGILLMLEGYNADGEVENFVRVSEIAIDQYEYTCRRIIEALDTDQYKDYKRID